MIQKGSLINIIDNSGAKKAFCINIVNCGYKQRYAGLGHVILVSIRKTKFSKHMRVKKGEIHPALIIFTKKITYSNTFNYRKFNKNSAVLLNKKNKLLGTRIFGKIPRILKSTKFLKLATLSSGILV